MKTILTIIISCALSLGGTYYLLTKAPLSWFTDVQKHLFGTTAITTIQGSDTISASRTTINNNFSSLNSNKVEISALAATTSLQNLVIPVGQISGVLAVANGGTASTSLTSNQVILGNTTSGFKVVNGLGSSGQFLTSGGAGVPPTWASASVDQTQNYSWSGNHNFTGNTYIKNLNASSTININGVALSFPAIQGASGLSLINDGSGNLTWSQQANKQYSMASTTSVTFNTNTLGSSASLIVPAGVLTASSTVTISGYFTCVNTGTNTNNCTMTLTNGSGDTFASCSMTVGTSKIGTGIFSATLASNNSLSVQAGVGNLIQIDNSAGIFIKECNGSATANFANSQSFKVTIQGSNNAGNTATINSFSLIVRP